jgi:hypothetical protein
MAEAGGDNLHTTIIVDGQPKVVPDYATVRVLLNCSPVDGLI